MFKVRLKPKLRVPRRPLVGLSAVIFLAFIFLWHLSSWTAGYSPAEANTIASSQSLHSLSQNPVNLPHNFLIWAFYKLGATGALALRAISAVFAVLFIGCFYKAARSWFGAQSALLASLIFATTPLVIIAGRNASADIMYLFPLTLGAVYFWLTRSESRPRALVILLMVLAGLSLYTPGLVYLVALGIIAVRKPLLTLYKRKPKWFLVVCLLAFFATLTPLILGVIDRPSLLKQLFLVPDHLPKAATFLKSLAWTVLGLGWRTGSHSDFQLGRLGLLSAAQLILIAFGLYAMWTRARAKTYGLLALLAVGVLGASLNNNFSLLLFSLIPASVFVAAGLRFLYIEWQNVFPRNPLPKYLAISLMAAVVAVHVMLGVRYSLIAWPHSVATRNTYVVKY